MEYTRAGILPYFRYFIKNVHMYNSLTEVDDSTNLTNIDTNVIISTLTRGKRV